MSSARRKAAARKRNKKPVKNLKQAPESSQLGVQSIEIGMQLMKAIVEHAFDNPPPMLKELAAEAGMPAAKAHRYMVSLMRAHLVERDEATRRYRLGPMARLLGLRAIQSIDAVRILAPRLPDICTQLGFSVAVAIWTYNGPAVIAIEEVRRVIMVGTRLGQVLPLLRSATGQVFAAWLPPAVTADLLKAEIGEQKRLGERPATKEQVATLLDVVRKTGVGSTTGGLNPTVNALSAPIFDHRGSLVAALSTLGPAHDFDADRKGALAVKLKSIAHAVSGELGYTRQFLGRLPSAQD